MAVLGLVNPPPHGRRSAPLSITIFSSGNPFQHPCSSIAITTLKRFQKFHGCRNSSRCHSRYPHTERKRKILSPAPEINPPIATRTVAKIVAPPHSPTTNATLTDTSQTSINKHDAVLRPLARPRPVHDGRRPAGPGTAIPATRGRGR